MLIDNTKDTVYIDAAAYAEVVSEAAEYRLFTYALLESASLDYTNKDLVFSSNTVEILLRAARPQAYERKVEELRKAKGLDE